MAKPKNVEQRMMYLRGACFKYGRYVCLEIRSVKHR